MQNPLHLVTPAGSTIDSEGTGVYRVCDRNHSCQEVDSLWKAQELAREAEVFHRPLFLAARVSDPSCSLAGP